MVTTLELNIEKASLPIADILDRILEGRDLSVNEAEKLLSADVDDLSAITRVAHHLRVKKHGKRTSFVVTRNINFTNVCHMGCNFCGFAKRKDSVEAELLLMEEIARRVLEAHKRGATEVCIQGGLHPNLPADYYRQIVQTVKKAVPQIHLHAFSPFEIHYGSRKSRLSYAEFLTDLKQCGLDSIPGTAAEILDVEVRNVLTKNKLSTDAWIDIVKTAHRVGLPSTSTMLYGHVDTPRHWANHIAVLRDIQKQTGGFTEFVPLGFVHYDSPLYLNNTDVRPGPTQRESIAVHAVARLMLHNYIDNIQVSWVKLGPQFARQMQFYGVNDLGGTLMNESISRSAGAQFGQEVTASEMTGLIQSAGFNAIQRNTLYQPLYSSVGQKYQKPLLKRSDWQCQQIQALEVGA